ncbi:PIN domain-containing protein [Rhodoferax sp.]|uniref:PIN domain-containing protein n=1 Tax=Rhodoferax sp. TaxID=50421 RepID=UPI00261C58AA|nr:PIN domain-containing protein [Rhodoferax sp.]MDD5480667.1 PIN domain-containing protein [Rhodoferax sp.]
MKIFIDTNVLIYWVDESARADRVEQLLAQTSVISVQVLNEFANVLRKKRGLSLDDIQALSNTLIETCLVHDLGVRTHQLALVLMARYNFSLYDANIVAAAGLSGCAVLYTEDMQDGLTVKLPDFAGGSTLSIRNPFRG